MLHNIAHMLRAKGMKACVFLLMYYGPLSGRNIVEFSVECHLKETDLDTLTLVLWGIQLRAVSQELYMNLIRNICPGIRLPKWLHFLWFSELSIDLVLSSCELVCIISVYEVANKFKRPNNYDNSSMKSWVDLPGTEYMCAVVFTAAYPLWTVMNIHFD